MALPRLLKDLANIVKLPDMPNRKNGGTLDANEFKALFDKAAIDIQEFINEELVPRIESDIDAAALGVGGAGSFDGSKLTEASVTGNKLVDGAVGTGKLADKSVAEGKVADDAVAERAIKNSAVTDAKIADDNVLTRHIADGAVTNAKLFTAAVTETKLASSAVTNAKLATSAVSTGKIADGSVTRVKLANDALYSPVLGANATDTINSSHIGKTFRTTVGTTDYVFNVIKDSAIPTGAEIAILRGYAKSCQIVFGADVRIGFEGETMWMNGGTFSIPTSFTMIALKKIATDTNYDYWFITGNAEVV